jgi:hypothetical protein
MRALFWTHGNVHFWKTAIRDSFEGMLGRDTVGTKKGEERLRRGSAERILGF